MRFLTDPMDAAASWPSIAPLLAPVVEEAARGEFTLEDIRTLAASGRVILGVCEFGGIPIMAMAFEFKHYPQYLAVNIMAIGGRNLDMVAENYWDKFRAWAASAGAVHIEALCSKAMARILNRYGFLNTYEQVRLPI